MTSARATVERIAAEFVQRARRGRQWGGRPPYGFRVRRETYRLVREPDPDQARIVRGIAARLLDGAPAETIAADLTRRGEPSPGGGAWRGDTLRGLVLRASTAGDGPWPALLDEQDVAQLRRTLLAPGRGGFRNATHGAYLGSGIYRCGRPGCTGRMRVVRQAGKLEARYACRSCYGVTRAVADVDGLVVAQVLARLSASEQLAALPAADLDIIAGGHVLAGELLAQAADVEVLVGQHGRDEQRLRVAGERWQHVAAAVHQGWPAVPLAARRLVVDALVDVLVLPARRGRAPFDAATVRVAWKPLADDAE